MSSLIRITDENVLNDIVQKFREALTKYKCSETSVSLSYPVAETDERATVYITAQAFIKMSALVQHFSKEVAWHATAHRSSEDRRLFIINDVFVYPQEVSGATVNTDQEEYQKWLYDLDEDVFNNLRAQGHSHVNMGVSPSSVDTNHQEQILAQLDDDMFYIFMIWNKSWDSYFKIYDAAENLIFYNDDIDIIVEGLDSSLADFLEDADSHVKQASSYTTAKSKSSSSQSTASEPGYYYPRYHYFDYEDYTGGGSK